MHNWVMKVPRHHCQYNFSSNMSNACRDIFGKYSSPNVKTLMLFFKRLTSICANSLLTVPLSDFLPFFFLPHSFVKLH